MNIDIYTCICMARPQTLVSVIHVLLEEPPKTLGALGIRFETPRFGRIVTGPPRASREFRISSNLLWVFNWWGFESGAVVVDTGAGMGAAEDTQRAAGTDWGFKVDLSPEVS